MAADSNLLGAWGESMAGSYLRQRRYKLIAANYRCRFGEIDIIASRGRYIAFVEVKMRGSDSFAEAREFVSAAKQRRIIAAAQFWLAGHRTELQPRFDVIEVYAPEGTRTRNPKINHIEDAFTL